MKSEGKIQVVVRSRRVPVGTVLRTEPVYSSSGVLVGFQPSTHVLFGTMLSENHQKTIEEAQKLANNLGLGLEVVDESRSGFVTRVLSRIGRSGLRYSSVRVPPSPHMVLSEAPPTAAQACQ
jgi:hypothetical protein